MSAIAAALLAALAPVATKAGLLALKIMIAVARNSADRGLNAAIAIGREAVRQIQAHPPTDVSKAAALFVMIGTEMLKAGRAITVSDLNLAVEMLVAELHLETGRPGTTVTAELLAAKS